MAKGSRRRRFVAGARAVGRWSVQGAKGSAAAGAAGVGTYYVSKLLAQKVETAAKHPIATQLALGAAGHFVKRRFQSLGAGMIGASGALVALAFDLNRQQVANKITGTETKALTSPGEISALTSPSEISGPMSDLDNMLETQGDNDGLSIDDAMALAG